ncbi:MAG: hypothetical protein D3903_07135 [Candidatus Electrothrix sp. GM3_4]|nr:hypothetical protein [Candidatus Electrothrix sp. GM3_4]
MSDLGKGIRGLVRVKTVFEHHGRKYAVGDMLEGRLIYYRGVIVFERIDSAHFDHAILDRVHGISCILTFAYDHIIIYKEDDIIKKKHYVKGQSGDGFLKEKDGEILFFLKGEYPITINKFIDKTDLNYKGRVRYEIEDITRLFDALG